MKYLDKKFSSPGNSKAFVDNWEAVFGDKPAPVCSTCRSGPDPQGPSVCACRAITAQPPSE